MLGVSFKDRNLELYLEGIIPLVASHRGFPKVRVVHYRQSIINQRCYQLSTWPTVEYITKHKGGRQKQPESRVAEQAQKATFRLGLAGAWLGTHSYEITRSESQRYFAELQLFLRSLDHQSLSLCGFVREFRERHFQPQLRVEQSVIQQINIATMETISTRSLRSHS